MNKDQAGTYAPLTLFDFPDPVDDSADSKVDSMLGSVASPQRIPTKSAAKVKHASMKAPKKSKELFGVTLGIGDFEPVKAEVEQKPVQVLIPYLKSKLRLSKAKKEPSGEEADDDDALGVKRIFKPTVPSFRKHNRPLSAAYPKEAPPEGGDSLKTILFSEQPVTPATMAIAPNYRDFALNRPKSAFPKPAEPKAPITAPSTLSKSGSLKLAMYKPGKTLAEIRKYEQAKDKAQHTVKQWLQEADKHKEVQVHRVTESMKKLRKEDLKIKQDIADIMKRFADRRASVQHSVTKLRATLKTKGKESETQIKQHTDVMQTFKTELTMLYNDSAKPILQYPQLDQPIKPKLVPSQATHPWVRDLEAVADDLSSIEPNLQLISDDDSFEDVEPNF